MTHRPLSVFRFPVSFAVVLALGLPIASPARADGFDERARRPSGVRVADFKVRAAHFLATVDPEHRAAVIEDPARYAEWLGLRDQIGAFADATTGDPRLAEVGVVAGGGVYRIDYRAFPQWQPLDEVMAAVLSPPDRFARVAAELQARGLRPSDLQTLKRYLDAHSFEADRLQRDLALARSFQQRLDVRARASRQRRARPERWEADAVAFQREHNTLEARRSWAVGALGVLDARARRIVESFLDENRGGITVFLSPDEVRMAAWIDHLAAGTLSAELEMRLREVAP